MIQPTPGRVVWYMPGTERAALGGGDDVLAAIVTYVHSDRLVNLVVFGVTGTTHARTSVKLLQDDEQEDFLGQPHAVWMPYQKGQAAKAESLEAKAVANLDKIERIARVCHEVNRAYCEALGDLSQPAWEDAPAWQRESARMGVDLHLCGDFGPEASHIGWMQQKVADGWTYGPEKNPELKQHPCMVPFAELPREQQAKDFIFRAVVHALR